MPPLPTWIDDRIDPALDKKLTQQHVVEVMLESERPFFRSSSSRARVKPTVSTETVRNGLDELREIDVVAAETYPTPLRCTTSTIPNRSGRSRRTGNGRSLTIHPSKRCRRVTSSDSGTRPGSGRWSWRASSSLVLFCVGVGMIVLSIEAPSTRVTGCGAAAGNLFVVCLVLLFAERAVPQQPSRRRRQRIDSDA